MTWETPAVCGLKDSVFIDYGHFNKEGAYLFTQRLFTELKNMGLMESGPMQGLGQGTAPSDAARKLEEKLKVSPHDYDMLCALGDFYSNSEKGKAMGYYESALSVRPDSPHAMERLAVLYSNAGEYGKAMLQLGHLKELQPDNANVYYNIACVMARQNKTAESIEWIKVAMAKGFKSRSALVTDKDLDTVKGSPAFRDLLKKCL